MCPQNELSMKEMINSFVDQNRLKPKLLEARLIESWPKIVGELIAKNTDKISVYKGQLILTIKSPALRHELKFQCKTIINLVNTELNCEFIDGLVIN